MPNHRRRPSRIPPSSLRHHRSPPTSPLHAVPRLSSEPLLPGLPYSPAGSPAPPAFLRNQTWTELCTSSHRSLPSSPFHPKGKVVVSVSVEGCPGPVRTMVRLAATVDDTIRQVVEQYKREGRSPRLDHGSSSSTSNLFQLHHSHFSLDKLDRSEKIGDVGSRSFYLRKSPTVNGSGKEVEPAADVSRDVPAFPPAMLASYVVRRMRKIGRRTKRLWTLLGCMSCE